MEYCNNKLRYQRRKTRVVYVGDIGIGGDNPIRVQSMTISDTMDTQATVDEIQRLAEVGCEIVRVTAPSIREAENLKNIKDELNRRGVAVPLVADIHFTPNAALIAAEYVEKVRINPGNYADKKIFEQREYTDDEYQQELLRIEEKFKPLVLKCKQLGRAMRIGVNHGSLSDRIMNRYGDTPDGMVESALEFVRICQKYDYQDIILSMKSSNPQVAIQAYRLLAARMDELGMDYPFHLGVTEAGGGEEGRIKSAVGIGALLEDGIGDTIRVSLTEDSVAEVPVAFELAKRYSELNKKTAPSGRTLAVAQNRKPVQLPHYKRRETVDCNLIYHKLGSRHLPRVELTFFEPLVNLDLAGQKATEILGENGHEKLALLDPPKRETDFKCETLHVKLQSEQDLDRLAVFKNDLLKSERHLPLAVDCTHFWASSLEVAGVADRVVFTPNASADTSKLQEIIRAAQRFDRAVEWKIPAIAENDRRDDWQSIDQTVERVLNACEEADFGNMLFSLAGDCNRPSIIWPYRYLAGRLDALAANFPILLRYSSAGSFNAILLEASTQLGSLLCDGIGDAIHIEANLPPKDLLQLSYNILQATRVRISKTEYISCPSCGRTLFDLQTTTERIKSKTAHLKGVKIAIMGCIVNGPGEMADADFGYVGAGPQKVNLFIGKECVKRNIPEAIADRELIALIKEQGKWVEP